MKLSIIIPVYKVEKYLRNCLDSCLSQDISKDEYEIICVNDGSPDNCPLILEEYSSHFSNIKIITQNNQGLSVARNNGLNNAIGDYIWFVDSDDTICKNILSSIIERLHSSPDLLQLNYQNTYEDNRNPEIKIFSIGNKTRVSGKYIVANGCLPAPAQFTIYRRNFLVENKLYFTPNIFHEDSEFKPRVTYLANSVEVFDKVAYNYLHRLNGSITSNFKLKNGLDIITVMKKLHNFYLAQVSEPSCRKGFCQQIGLNANTLLDGIKNLKPSEHSKVVDELLSNKNLFTDMVKSGILKYIIEGIMLYLSPKPALLLHKILKRL